MGKVVNQLLTFLINLFPFFSITFMLLLQFSHLLFITFDLLYSSLNSSIFLTGVVNMTCSRHIFCDCFLYRFTKTFNKGFSSHFFLYKSI